MRGCPREYRTPAWNRPKWWHEGRSNIIARVMRERGPTLGTLFAVICSGRGTTAEERLFFDFPGELSFERMFSSFPLWKMIKKEPPPPPKQITIDGVPFESALDSILGGR